MGKLLRQQRRGKGSVAYKAPSHRYKSELAFRKFDDGEKSGAVRGEVLRFVDDPARGALLMDIIFEDGSRMHLLAPEGMAKGQEIMSGSSARLGLGSCLPLSKIPEGSMIYNIEMAPGDGGKLVRAPGSYATIVSREKDSVYVKLPSKHTLILQGTCRAQIGVVCGGGRLEKPLLKAGNNFYKKHAQNRKWPVNRGVHMSAYTHPFGGKQHHKGRGSATSRNAPPGRKVGHIAARSTGRKKAHVEEQKLASANK
ncbi:TPA: 50S ribosomal protein L2 [Candidatus Micrarchaeota archaeon]|nr:50S ribosomal protein L2P [uncultured archaeon]HIH19131.1 50S ribosomal protein L2 [Candidatus Micrarchaeota archaeon]HIH29835.1 50S ribosomal protein L2 [Candidatus Micrarchaeota archaeon]